MKIILIGSGNVATVLGKRFQAAGHTFPQVLSPQAAHAGLLAGLLGAQPITTPDALQKDADLYLIATGDDAVYALGATLRLGDALVAHTAGAVPLDALKNVSSRYGVLYPLQSLRKEVDPQVRIPLLIDGSSDSVKAILSNLALQVSDLVNFCTDRDRLIFHIGAVMVNNFPNYLYTLTETYLTDQGLDWKLLLPLLGETVGRLDNFSPAEMQTGPAYRGDERTLALHRALLEGYPELGEWYSRFSEKIQHSLAFSRH